MTPPQDQSRRAMLAQEAWDKYWRNLRALIEERKKGDPGVGSGLQLYRHGAHTKLLRQSGQRVKQ